MNQKSVTLIGASGLIGSHLLQILINDAEISSIKVLSRKQLSYTHPKIRVAVIDFGDKEAFAAEMKGSEIVFCAVGTTKQKTKGDKKEYRKVDFDIPVNAANFCVAAGCPHFVFVSSLGANSKSTNFYLKLKGEVEDAICGMGIETILVFRPSILLGKRQEFRFGEWMAKLFFTPISFLFPSQLRPIQAEQVAKSMIIAAKKELKGVHIFHYKEMMPLINRYDTKGI
ncbi:MAG: NAD(P)H-binding protein [Bacteroidales bacterium]|nr:NAD(P)H-binding protein [Bacteroidales bacterium]MDD4209441.1 NAD(P)H-binding protein [Bacteroidales bacterium]